MIENVKAPGESRTGREETEANMRLSHVVQALNKPPFCVLKRNWPLYVCEAIELALFMLSACAFTIFLFDPAWPAFHLFPSAIIRRTLMAIAMGITALLIIHSPMGKRSGAHFNPAITLTYLRLGKIGLWDAVFYVCFQFMGGSLWGGCRSDHFW